MNTATAVSSHYREGYFMSAEQEDQAQAAVLLNFAKTKKRLAVLEEEARTIGRELSSLGSALERSPEFVSFDGQGMGANYHVKRQDFKAASLDPKRIANLADDIRKTLDEKRHLEDKVKQLGLDV
jgi:hypothetical protein